MTDRSRAVAILPCSDLNAAESWWGRLGFVGSPGDNHEGYRMLTDEAGAEIHLCEAVPGWLVPARNPFGIYLYTARVDAIADSVREEIIGKAKRPEHKAWGMYEFALNGPDDLLVRVGRPSAADEGPRPAKDGDPAEAARP
jgi:hypothetical protein